MGGGILFPLVFLLVRTDAFYERLMPTLMLDSPCAVMEGSKHALLVITINGQVYSW